MKFWTELKHSFCVLVGMLQDENGHLPRQSHFHYFCFFYDLLIDAGHFLLGWRYLEPVRYGLLNIEYKLLHCIKSFYNIKSSFFTTLYTCIIRAINCTSIRWQLKCFFFGSCNLTQWWRRYSFECHCT